MCVGCHEMREKGDLIRVLKMQDNTFCIDPAGRKNGRGAYSVSYTHLDVYKRQAQAAIADEK